MLLTSSTFDDVHVIDLSTIILSDKNPNNSICKIVWKPIQNIHHLKEQKSSRYKHVFHYNDVDIRTIDMVITRYYMYVACIIFSLCCICLYFENMANAIVERRVSILQSRILFGYQMQISSLLPIDMFNTCCVHLDTTFLICYNAGLFLSLTYRKSHEYIISIRNNNRQSITYILLTQTDAIVTVVTLTGITFSWRSLQPRFARNVLIIFCWVLL